ncbi:PIKK family atypical protein kinase [Tritrichomonas foetus]|uniref:non-specific serine/threonine protein kinase n=1 Tax=Tritrichomonas foetus TaxID=1144522 RepID=A0A1J4JBK2_9EUKA|nr:PIKK family atypical protein kinase [Tritrichomonas foetus]|eukprot:OHS96520.1 PIKK family atypical protein kinase [Tritrichomonas foetus]
MIFSVMTKIIEAEPEYSAKYINKIFPLFLKTCNRPSYKHREILFEYMGIISTKCKNEIVPFFPYISLLVKKFIDSVSCIKYLTLLSYTFNSLFTPFAEDLFYLALSKLDNTENNYVKYLLKLLSICGIVHNLWFDSYIHALEEKIRKGISSYFAKQILKNMLIVISLSDYFQIFISRIILIAVSILPINYESAMNILSCIYNDHINDYQYITYMLESKNISCKDLQNYKYTIPKLEIKVISVYEKPIGRPKDKNIFVGIQYQPEETINSFFDELFRVSLTYTPSPAIYSCRDLSTQSLPFVQHLLPFAFLSCWKEASDADRKYLSGLLNRIINEHSQLHPMFIRLVEVLHRTKIAPKIDLLKFVNLSSSHQFSLYLLEKTYLHEPNNQEVIKKLIDLNLSMNRISIAQSLFNKIQPNLKKIQQAEMSMSLGHWEKALDLYSDEINCNCDFEKGSVNSHLPMITEALYKLHRYSDILKYEKEFEESEGDEKDSLLLPFAWAYFQNENMEKLKPIINQLPKNSTLPRMLLVCLYYLSIQKLDKAQDTIDKTCQYIVMHKELLTSFGEFYQMQDTLSMIQLIVECNEVSRFLSGKKHTTESLLKLWYHRIKGYHRDEFSWLVLLNLHKRLIDYDMNIHYTLKIISQIRKDRQFKTFISYFAPFFQFSTDCDVILANIKIMWAMKTHSKVAFNSLSNIVKILGDKPYKLFVEAFSKNYIALGQILIQSVCFNHKELDLDVKQEMLSYCNFHHFEEFLANYRNLPTEKISNLINHLVKKHPEPVFEAINKNILKKITPNQKSRFYRLYADYSSLINANNQTNLQESINYLEIASSLSPNDQKIWKLYGKLNLQMMSLCFDNNNNYNEFAQNAIKAYSKAIVLRPSDSDDCIVQITYALQNSNLGGKIEDYLDAIYQVPNSVLKKVVPQLLINISHTNDFVSNITVNILSSFGAEHFQAVLYDLNLYTLVENKKQSNLALKLLRSLAQQNLEIAKDASLFIDGMVRCSMTWFECWINAIEKSLQLVGSNPTAARQVIHEQLKQYENPRCEFDYMFIEMYSVIIQKIQQLYHKNTSSSNKFMWNSMNSFLRVLKEQENRLSTLFLNKISLELFNKRGFQLACPGKYKVEGDFPLIYQIESAMEIILTQQHPRQITMIANTGEKFKYLLKGNEDLRLDQRIMQFFELVNTILRKDIKTKEIGAIISRYPVIPITPYSGFISWVINSDTMYQMVMDYRKAKGETLYPDFEQLHEYSVVDFQLLNSLQRLESYQYVCEKYKAHELFNTFWIKSPNAAIWQYRREKYTISSAVMSMIGYIIGLGDRHPGNIMIQRDSGNVTHIDFGDSFEAATLRSSFPEKVPFRLTRMITNAFCGCTNDGYFKMICEAVMTVLRYNGTTLSTQLSIFMCEIFDNYCGRDKYYMKRINAKLHGQKWENGELVPIHETDIEEHVNNLINEAENPFNFARHYSGWCPFW